MSAPAAEAAAVWDIDLAHPPTMKTMTFTARVTRLGCSNGETGEVLKPKVSNAPDEIRVTFSVKALPPGDSTCPSNDQVPYPVDLGEPIGNRKLVDGACVAGEAVPTSFCLNGPVRWPPKTAR